MQVIAIVVWLLFGLVAGQPPPEAATSPPTNTSLVGNYGWGPILRSATCSFVYTSPRFYRLQAEITLQGVASDSELLLNDALIRLLRDELGLSDCQLGMSQGTNCTSGTQQLPCSDPVFNCGNGIIISEDIYNAVLNGDCNQTSPANNTLVCASLALNPAIPTVVASGTCRPACMSGSAQATQELPVGCTSYLLEIDSAERSGATAAAAALGNTTLQSQVGSSLSSYSNGPGIQLLVVNSAIQASVGYGFFPPPPPPMAPIVPGSSSSTLPPAMSTNTTANNLASSGMLVYGPWTPCIPACGEGLSIRTATCFAPDGTLLPLQACPGGAAAQTSQTCTGDCSEGESYYEYAPWSPCNATCGGGVSSRQAYCVSSAPGGGTGTCATDPPEALTQTCNTAPCTSFSWAVSAWSECSVGCDGGNRTRTVMCVDSTGLQASYSQCPGRKPRSTEQCNLQACDFCANNPCLGRGTCGNNTCACNVGYSGAYCETPTSCPSGIVDANLACCESGLVNVRGECCDAGTRLDADGACCSQTIDVCGVCGGSGAFVDMQGSCCSVADANGVCCPSGQVDECGVCDGVGNSCAVQLNADVNVPDSAAYVVDGNATASWVYLDPLNQYFAGAAAVLGLTGSTVSVVGNVSSSSATDGASGGAPPPLQYRRRKMLVVALKGGGGKRKLRQEQQQQQQQADFNGLAALGSTPSTATTADSTTTTTPPPLPQPIPPTPPPTMALGTTVNIMPSPNNTGTTPFSSSYIAQQLPAAATASQNATATGITMVGTPSPGRIGICGNGVCEIGERSTVGAIEGSCPQDCGLPAIACLGGCGVGGNCLPSTGVCMCYVGYQGTNCNDCAPGFIKTGGVCVASVTALDLVNASVLSSTGEALVTGMESNGGGTDVGLIVGVVIGGVVGAVLLVVACCCLRRCWVRRREYNEHIKGAITTTGGANKMYYSNGLYDAETGGGGGGEGNASGGAVAVEDDIGLRQRYGIMGPDGGYNSARSQQSIGPYHVHVDVSSATARSHGGGGGGEAGGWQSARSTTAEDIIMAGGPGAVAGGQPPNAYVVNMAMDRRDTFTMPADAQMMLSNPLGAGRNKKIATGTLGPMGGGGGSGGAGMHDEEGSMTIPAVYTNTRPQPQQQQMMMPRYSSSGSAVMPMPPMPPLPLSGRSRQYMNRGEEDYGRQHPHSARGGSAQHEQFYDAVDVDKTTTTAARIVHPPIVPDPQEDVRASSSLTTTTETSSALSSPPPLSQQQPLVQAIPTNERMFFNPAFSAELKPSSRPHSARSIPDGETVADRRAKLDALRAAVRALEQQSSSSTAVASSSTAEQQQRAFLPGRPSVPRLTLSNIHAKPSGGSKNKNQAADARVVQSAEFHTVMEQVDGALKHSPIKQPQRQKQKRATRNDENASGNVPPPKAVWK